jgi:hypothetical protein
MRIPLVVAPALVLAVGLAVGLASLGSTTADDPVGEQITLRAPTVPEPGEAGAAPPVPAAPPERHRPAEPAPRDPAGYVAPRPPAAGDDDDAVDDGPADRADPDRADPDEDDPDGADDDGVDDDD